MGPRQLAFEGPQSKCERGGGGGGGGSPLRSSKYERGEGSHLAIAQIRAGGGGGVHLRSPKYEGGGGVPLAIAQIRAQGGPSCN